MRPLPNLAPAACVLLALACGPTPAPTPPPPPPPATGDVPYSLTLEAFSIDGLPGLHSYAYAGTANQAVLLAGRTNGLHGFEPSRKAAEFPSFPTEYANNVIYLVDLTQRKLLGQATIDNLPKPYANQLQASNTQYYLDGDWLYVAGGYGPDPSTGVMATLPLLTVIDFQALVQTLSSGGALDATFAGANMAMFQHPALAITGGDVQLLGNQFLVVYGQRFDGVYTPGGGQVSQEYSNSVRVFTVSTARGESGLELAVTYQGADPNSTSGMDPDNPYHRRDLNVAPAMSPSGQERIGVYGGVFKGGRMEGYEEPIYITADSLSQPLGLLIQEDTAAHQLLSQYDCAQLQLYSTSRQTMYSTFFGGMSYYYWEESCSCLQHDTLDLNMGIDGLPFINSISTLQVTGAGTAQFLHTGATFPPASAMPQCKAADGTWVNADLLGSETKLILVPNLPLTTNGVLQLDSIQETTVIGYLVGGIASTAAYGSTQGVTCASDQIYQLTLNPSQATSTVKLEAPVG